MGMGFVMLPVFGSGIPGAYGSVWETEFAAYNSGSESARYMPLVVTLPVLGFVEFAAGGGEKVQTAQFHPRLHWIEASKLGRFHFTLRTRDLSRQAQSAGVDIPVVRESEFRERVTLVNVPTETSFRHSLRIYDPRFGDREVRLRISEYAGIAFRPEPQNVLVDQIITLKGQPDPHGSIWAAPADAALHDLTTIYPQLRTVPFVRIDVDPVQSDGKLWAFVAITNNASQEFTLITPQ